MRCMPPLEKHFAMIGAAAVVDGYPLYFEATNEKGLSMAGLNFPDNADYKPCCKSKCNVAPFELIPWLLGKCASVDDAVALLESVNVADFKNFLGTPEIIDLCADGISRGSYKINNADGKMIEQNYAIPDAGYRTFFATTLNVGTDVENLNSEKLNVAFNNSAKNIISSQVAQITLYSVAGKLIVSQYGDILSTDNIAPGVYILTVATQQEKVTQKILVK